DYFRWRMADAARCCLNGHAYWLLRRQGEDAQQASSTLLRTSQSDKHNLLFANGINFDALPAWQKRGFGVYWADLEKSGRNLKTGEPTITQRRVLQLDFELPMGDTYACALQGLLDGGEFKSANPAENANIP
ncbi:MAG: hypothetical protein ACOYNF_19465, partial [Rhodoferax sp.]